MKPSQRIRCRGRVSQRRSFFLLFPNARIISDPKRLAELNAELAGGQQPPHNVHRSRLTKG
jgi:hypothetical protein